MLTRLESITPNTLELVVSLSNNQISDKLRAYLQGGGSLVPCKFILDTFKGKMVSTCSISLNTHGEGVVRAIMTPAIEQLYYKDFIGDINHVADLVQNGDFNYDALWTSPNGDPTNPLASIHSLNRVSLWLN